ncbi:MFS transporter [Streptomyces roseoverticillatus]|uniref:MFS transporter n=1 Tax=Streptomyces roseoverticillatus TaxID=66429 RepID=A0ABV3J7F7_9ACTN
MPVPGRSIAAGLIGTTLTWYDFFLYVNASVLVFKHQFFPYLAPFTAVLTAVSLYGVSLVARPLGGLLFGHIGDRHGRRAALVATLVLTGAATGLIGVLPPYREAGIAAPLLLVALRLLQGLGLGGAWASAAVVALECAPPERRGRVSSWAQIGAPAGNLLAFGMLTGVSALMSPGAFLTWGWRLPFLLSALPVVAGLWARARIAESGPYEELSSAGERAARPIAALLSAHRTELLTATAIALGADVVLFAFSFGSVLFSLKVAGLSVTVLVAAAVLAPLGLIALIPFFGALSDRWGARRVCLAGTAGTALWAAAFVPLSRAGSPSALAAGCILALVAFAAMYAPQAALVAGLFPGRVRLSGTAAGNQLAGLLGGTLALAVSGASWARGPLAVPLYAAAALVLSGAALLFARRFTPPTHGAPT